NTKVAVVDGALSVTALPGTPFSDDAFLIRSGASLQSTGSGSITITSDTVRLGAGSSIAAGTNTVSFLTQTAGTPINLGSTAVAAGNLNLSNAEFAAVTSGTINVGDSNAGNITINQAIGRSANWNLTA